MKYPIEVQCECCGHVRRTYRRTFMKKDLNTLVSLYRKPQDWHHVDDLEGYSGSGEWAKLRWWDLIEEMPKDPLNKKPHLGFWRLTEMGKHFIEGRAYVWSHVVVTDNVVEKFDGTQLNWREVCDSSDFSYAELMGIER